MKKTLIGIALILCGAGILIGLIACTGCVSVPRGPVFTWSQLSAGHWEAHVMQPRCPGCPAQTNVVWCPPTWGWKPVTN